MQKRKGFTLVELVIVIAVIAILAGVLIGTFASVINKANESAKMQELKAQEHEQKANDLLKKIEDSNWYGWEDFETSIVDKITKAIDNAKTSTVDVKIDSQVVQKAVSEAMSKYYAEHAMGNTSLTEEQVKAIVENALGSFKFSGVTAEQVKTIVEKAVSTTGTTLTAAQVQRIVNAAADRVEAGQLTSGQITTIVANAFAANKVDLSSVATSEQVENAINNLISAIGSKECSTLTAKQVEEIVNAAVVKAGTTSWVSPEKYQTEEKFELKTADDVIGLATLVNGGYDFEDKVVELPAVLDFEGKEFTPIGNTRGSEFKGTLGGAVEVDPTSGDKTVTTTVIKNLTLEQEFNAIVKGYLINCSSTGYMDKVGVGFVAYLGEDAILQYVDFEDVNINITQTNLDGVYYDGVSLGVAVGMLDGGTIDHVNVKSGTVKSVYRTAGLVGAARCGTIKDCTVGSNSKVEIESTAIGAKYFNDNTKQYEDVTATKGNGYCTANGLIGYLRNFISKDSANKTSVTISNCTVNASLKSIAIKNLVAGDWSNATINGLTSIPGDGFTGTGVNVSNITLV